MATSTGADRPFLAPSAGVTAGVQAESRPVEDGSGEAADRRAAPPASGNWGPQVLGPLLAALVVLIAALPGLARMPTLDRDEARFAQSSAQMLESGDFIDPRFQDESRDKKPVGVNWLQAAAVKLVSSETARQIWPYRLPSLLGAMAAAAACAWAAQAFFRPWRAA
ncbi:MAG: hypothetical protein WA840_16455, partial [Caulobacteraceae bacterium]